MSELEFLGALRLEMARRGDLRPDGHPHQLFQTSTIDALLGGAFDGDVSLSEILKHGDLGLGTLNGLDGELIVIDGQAWKADADCALSPAPDSSRTPYAVVVEFSPGPPVTLFGPVGYASLGEAIGHPLKGTRSPLAVRIDGRFEHVRVRSVPKQRRPYPSLIEALVQERISDLRDVRGTMVGFGFPDALDGVEVLGWHLHFASHSRTRGGHVLEFRLAHGVARLDLATELQVELPPSVDAHSPTRSDEDALGRLEHEG